MKPINSRDIARSYRNFILLFLLLLVFTVTGVYFYFLTADHEVILLNERAREADRLMAIRNDINYDFEKILQRMKQLSDFTSTQDASEINNQTLLLNEIQETNQDIQNKVQADLTLPKSFQLYLKLSNNIRTAATIKDSLSTTRFMIESLRQQLETCNHTNETAVKKIKGGFNR